jgi:microcystin-dependent protein
MNDNITGMAASPANNYPNGKTESGESVASIGPSLVTANAGAITPTGSNVPVAIMPPYLSVFFILCLYGVFPSRN